ncbi:hypothetical protein HGM15179_003619 [Zosterops borbonicus]|uniref:Rad60/SUMO-like domain-containing protein n=1 Tax=Zosterops borbonicus TaxID=364589 RepID=A0A8K1LRB7_9PASS|nr:hypothetical protein HGM15179_003619 [Zosterops borbonicus]
MSEEKAREGVETEKEHIDLKVAGQDGSVVQFRIKRHTPLRKLMKAYCCRQGLSMRHIMFLFDGQPIRESDTPAQGLSMRHIMFLFDGQPIRESDTPAQINLVNGGWEGMPLNVTKLQKS